MIIFSLVYFFQDTFYYFGLVQIPKPKPNLADTFVQYRKSICNKRYLEKMSFITNNMYFFRVLGKRGKITSEAGLDKSSKTVSS